MYIRGSLVAAASVFIMAVCALATTVMLPQRAHAGRFGLPSVIAQARARAAAAYEPLPQVNVLRRFTYDQYRSIHFRPTRTLWRHRAFQLQMFAPGYRFTRPVAITIIDRHGRQRLPFVLADFHYPQGLYPGHLPPTIGFAGMRLLYRRYPVNRHRAGENGQVIVFLGPSYFRVKGADEQFGVSARAVAIDTIASHREEFPRFIHFWVRRPAVKARTIIVYALLDSRAVTGAFRFRIHPGPTAYVDVRSQLFLRHAVHEFGLTPLSSMYMYDIDDRHPWAYLRPAVHDSEGLLIEIGQRFIWRQLANPRVVTQFRFTANNPRGFGLLQRDRNFFDYESPSMRYQGRPSVWITRRGSWGAGAVTLVEIPTPNETNDNIVAMWTPRHEPLPLTPLVFNYRMTWGRHGPHETVARVTHTYGTLRCLRRPITFAVDYAGGILGARPMAPLTPHVTAGVNGRISAVHIEPVRADGHWRLLFTVRSINRKPMRVRAWLTQHGQRVTEVWDYVVARQQRPWDAPGTRQRATPHHARR
ncbi:MAG: glucan biosynthesis protein [Acidiferrobacter sp.]